MSDLAEKTARACGVGGCTKPAYCRGSCTMHYQRLRKHGDTRKPARRRRSVEDALLAYTSRGEHCWTWTGPVNQDGYGIIWLGTSRYVMAHRASYESARGQIATGKVLDHLCRNRVCVNPEHLEPVANRENVLRGVGITATNARKTHCAHGHPFDVENTYSRPDGDRGCRACRAESDSRRKHAARIARGGAS